MKKFDKARECLETAAEKDPDDFETHFNLGVFMMDHEKDLNVALKNLHRCQELETEQPGDKIKVLYNIAKTYELQRDTEKAIEYYD